MKLEIKLTVDEIAESHGQKAVEDACLYIMERGILYAGAETVEELPMGPALWAAQICHAAGENAQAVLEAVAELSLPDHIEAAQPHQDFCYMEAFFLKIAEDIVTNVGPCCMCDRNCEQQVSGLTCLHGVKDWLLSKWQEKT